METIIGLLFILLPVIFKLIGRKFEQSGQTGKADVLKELAKAFGEEGDDAEPEAVYDIVPAPKPKAMPVKSKIAEEGVKSVSRKQVLLEEEPKKKGEKIDPEKLILYSEIMKPKFDE